MALTIDLCMYQLSNYTPMETFYFKAPSTIALQDKELQISRNHQVQRIALSDVKKIFLKKRKKSRQST